MIETYGPRQDGRGPAWLRALRIPGKARTRSWRGGCDQLTPVLRGADRTARRCRRWRAP